MDNCLKFKTCCFTGHRAINDAGGLSERLEGIIEFLYKKGFRYFGCGGARGFDTAAALAVIATRQKHSDIKLILVLPCMGQDRFWRQDERYLYKKIKTAADKTVYISESYYEGCMQKRNRHLVDNSSCCVCYHNKWTGGTAYTVSYAQLRGLSVYNLAT